jgi:hypothetical protein
MSFIERSFYELNPQTPFFGAPYIELMASKLEACRRGKIKRLIINLPPRQLKSHSASIAFVAWLLGHEFRRAEGEALHPEREPLATLARMRESMGEYHFASQYQQSPIAKGGAIVKTSWIQHYDEANTFCFCLTTNSSARNFNSSRHRVIPRSWGRHPTRRSSSRLN